MTTNLTRTAIGRLLTMNDLLKELRTVFRNEYANIVREYHTNKLDDEQIDIYINNFPNIFAVLSRYDAESSESERQERYKSTIHNDTTLASKFRDKAKEELALIQEELTMTQRGYALEPTKALAKYNKEKRLNKRIEETQKTIDTLDKLIIELAPPKRKVGRPKKNKDDITN